MHALAAAAAVAAITAAFFRWLHVTDATTVALVYLLVVLFVAASSQLWVAVTTSLISALALNFFFLPPILTLNIDEAQDWVAFLTFIVVSVVASRLSSLARTRARELSRLFEFSRDALVESGDGAFRLLARHVADRFRLDYVAFYLPDGDGFARYETGILEPRTMPDAETLRRVASGTAKDTGNLFVKAPDVAVWAEDTRYALWLVPLRHGPEAVGVLAAGGRRLEPTTLRALAGAVAIAVERARLLEQRQQAEVTRRSVEIKSALLSSLAHDIRTPLTAIGAAISNLGNASLRDPDRDRQADVARAGLNRLQRLFENILEMASLDAGGTAPSPRWVHPSEVIQAARNQVDYALRGHEVRIEDGMAEQVAHLDPRLLATALAHLLENAAQYSPPGAPITVSSEIVSGGVTLHVDDRGAGVADDDLSHIFERFYRGAKTAEYRSGTGMGLAIVRGLMEAQHGRASAENLSSGGARFSLFVPAPIRTSTDE